MRFDEATYRQILGAMSKVAVFIVDDRSIHRLCGGDPQVLADTGFFPREVEGQEVGFSGDKTDVWRANIVAVKAAIDRGVESEGIVTEWRARHYESSVKPIMEGAEVVGAVLTVRDVSHRRGRELALEQFARVDGLTGLANRNRLHNVLRRSTRGGTPFAVLVLDLDGFKALNDSRGHEAGDTCLRNVARVLEAATRASDTVARVGGDEFALILSELHTTEALAVVTARIRAGIDGIGCGVSASIGVAVFPEASADPDALLRLADSAMYDDKRARKAQKATP